MILLHLITILLVISITLWLINKIPMPYYIKRIINIIIVVSVIIWLLILIFGGLGGIKLSQ